MAKKKHLLIAGHGKQKNGGFDPGATGLISKGEHRYMKEDLFPAMKKFLPKNHDLVFFDDYNVYSYGNIVSLAKKYNADQITEFHFDAAGASATGGHVIIHSSYSPDKMDLALRDTIKSMVGTIYTHKGHAGVSGRNNLANVNRTANAGITYRLVELGFGTNKDNAKVLTEDVETYAKKLVKTLTGTTNDKKPSTSKPESKPKPSKPQSNKLTIDGSWGKATSKRAQEVYGMKIIDSVVSGQPKNANTKNIPSAEYGTSGSNLIKAMQAEFGVPAKYRDGKITYPSMLITNMQKHYGTPQDSKVSYPSMVIKEWQKALNKGKRK